MRLNYCVAANPFVWYNVQNREFGVEGITMAKNGSFAENIANTIDERLVNFIVGLIGVILVLIGILSSTTIGPTWEAVIISVGASLIASAIVSYLTSIYIFKRKRAKDITEKWGLRTICETRAEMNTIVTGRIEKAQNHLDIIAYGLSSLRESRTPLLKRKVAHGLNIRILTVDPNCELLKQKDADENKQPGATAASIRALCKWIVELQKIQGAKVEIKFCSSLPTEVFFRVDDYIYTGPYQWARDSQRSITMEYRNLGQAFEYYKEYFDGLWKNKAFCAENQTILHQ